MISRSSVRPLLSSLSSYFSLPFFISFCQAYSRGQLGITYGLNDDDWAFMKSVLLTNSRDRDESSVAKPFDYTNMFNGVGGKFGAAQTLVALLLVRVFMEF